MKDFMSSSSSLAGAFALLILSSSLAFSQSAATDPVGFIADTIPAQTDAAVTAPLNRPAVFQGTIASISGTTITATGSPAWVTSPQQFVHVTGTQPNTYYVEIGNGTKAGLYAAITANGTNTINVQLNAGDDLTAIATEATAGVGNGAKITIFPFWTPSTLFPTSWPSGVEVFLYDANVPGVNLAPSQILGYDGTHWIDESLGSDASDFLIHPADSFVVRNNTGNSIARVVMGSVPMIHHRSLISTLQANTDQDVRIAYSSPASQIIGTLALGFQAGDQLLIFDNTSLGMNKSASQVLGYNGSAWLDQTTGTDVTNTFSLQPGLGYVYRKIATSTPQDFVWQATQTYNP